MTGTARSTYAESHRVDDLKRILGWMQDRARSVLPRSISYADAKRAAIAIIGGTGLLAGLVLLFIPGPGLVLIIFGLAVLAVEFTWARRWLARIKSRSA